MSTRCQLLSQHAHPGFGAQLNLGAARQATLHVDQRVEPLAAVPQLPQVVVLRVIRR